MSPNSQATASPVAIVPDLMYPVPEAQRITGWKKDAWRSRLDEGLKDKVRYSGGRAFILGRDLIDHILTHGRTTKTDLHAEQQERRRTQSTAVAVA